MELTRVTGCLWDHSLTNKRSRRNEMLLMNEFWKGGFILPDLEQQ